MVHRVRAGRTLRGGQPESSLMTPADAAAAATSATSPLSGVRPHAPEQKRRRGAGSTAPPRRGLSQVAGAVLALGHGVSAGASARPRGRGGD